MSSHAVLTMYLICTPLWQRTREQQKLGCTCMVANNDQHAMPMKLKGKMKNNREGVVESEITQ